MKEKERIFFIYPPSRVMNRMDNLQKPIADAVDSPYLPPVDMMSLSSIAKIRGYETKFKDYSFDNQTIYDFLRDLREYKPAFLVINVSSATLEKDLAILDEAQDLLQETLVIVKGAMFNFSSYNIMQKYPGIDIALRGEIEEAFDEIIQYKNLKDIKGITYQLNNKIISTQDRPLKESLDHLPVLDRDLIDNDVYFRPDTKKPITVITVEKGCPNNCFFCLSSSLNGKNIRLRSPELILEEIEDCIFKYNIKDFVFNSDLFNLNKKWTQKLCRAILNLPFKINFSVSMGINEIDCETLKLLKKAGCYLISLGIESGSDEILSKIGKQITIEQIKNIVEMIEKEDISIHANYILGLPWETRQTIEQTYEFAKELNTEFATFNTAVPFVGTRFYDYVIKNRLGSINYDDPYTFPCVKNYNMSDQELLEYNKQFNKNYYLRPKYLLKMAKKAKSMAMLKNQYDIFVKLAKKN